MPVTFIFKSGNVSFVVKEGTIRHRRFFSFGKRRGVAMNGDLLAWNQRDILFEQFTSPDEWEKRKQQRDEERKKNPNPGAPGRVFVPR